jgi:hypothetical protein
MTTIEAKIPDLVLKQAEELAEREQISLEQLIGLAVTQAIGIWSLNSNAVKNSNLKLVL